MLRRFMILLAVFASITATHANAEPARYKFDKEHTSITFFVNHLGYSNMAGRFNDYDGYFIFDQESPLDSKVEVTVKPASVDTVSKELDKHLQGEKWFNTAKFPEIKFRSTQVKVTGDKDAELTGWLTLLGVEKAITMKVKFNKAGEFAMDKSRYIAGFSADTTINRSQFGMNEGVPFVSEDVRIHIEVEGIREENMVISEPAETKPAN